MLRSLGNIQVSMAAGPLTCVQRLTCEWTWRKESRYLFVYVWMPAPCLCLQVLSLQVLQVSVRMPVPAPAIPRLFLQARTQSLSTLPRPLALACALARAVHPYSPVFRPRSFQACTNLTYPSSANQDSQSAHCRNTSCVGHPVTMMFFHRRLLSLSSLLMLLRGHYVLLPQFKCFINLVTGCQSE